ncbi:sigma-54-dependent Fis family transcriptional regulator [Paenibacillus sp. GCM10027628]|uniref:sigma-54-dependent Fis family transcriptional regulator n=1 Tax=Paenibacillus sp. GCM10027628 TaxID=3273413 RepID=UPI003625755F
MSSLFTTDFSDITAKSWKRCQEYGLKPFEPVHDVLIAENGLRELVKQNAPIIAHTRQVFDTCSRFIQESKQTALLIDAQGTIIHAVGDPDFATQAQRVQLQVGASWDEKRKGTNAIGVAITEQKPVRVHAEEHYFEANRFLTCASAPVFSPTGELLGVINISGKRESYHAYTLILACLAADSLQNRLLLEASKKEHLLTLKELDYTMGQHAMPLLSLDSDNRILRANQAALQILGKDAIGREFTGAKGFAVETLLDERHKVWRSVAVQKPVQADEDRLYGFHDIAGTCPGFVQTKELAQKAALTVHPVLLLGESGTGKELFAQSIHTASARAAQPFVAVNCSAIPDTLVESELFGYERGAFTGASRDGSKGKFEAAHRGTLFLDEIGDMSLRAQAALLRVLQEGTITPVGATKSRRVDTRIIAATHRNLPEEVKAGRFRADLFYRLKGIQLHLPPLRERTDLLSLTLHLLNRSGYATPILTSEAQQKLLQHAWPGNLRELNSVLIQACFLAEGGPIGAQHIRLDDIEPASSAVGASADVPTAASMSLRDVEIAAIQRALKQTSWNLSKAASLLQIGRTTLYRKIEEYGIKPF